MANLLETVDINKKLVEYVFIYKRDFYFLVNIPIFEVKRYVKDTIVHNF